MKNRSLFIILPFLGVFLLPCYSLEEQQYQARIYGGEKKEPVWIFPLSDISYENVKSLFLKEDIAADYMIYTDPEDQRLDTRDLCGFRKPETDFAEGDRP